MGKMDSMKAIMAALAARGNAAEPEQVIPGADGDPDSPGSLGAAERGLMPQMKKLAPGVPQGNQEYPTILGGDARAYDSGFNQPDSWAVTNALRALFGRRGDGSNFSPPK